jgi:dTDP-4-amino-4,6-dideoxygalactose transaminase
MNPRLIEKKILRKTRVILPVHLYGQCADMAAIKKVGEEYKIPILEDGAQAFGALQNGKRTGTMGTMGAFSFYPSKNLGACGDGGLIVSHQKNLMDKIRMLRVQGTRRKYIHEVVGYNSRLDTIQAAILRIKLKHIDRWNQKRREKADFYNRLFRGVKEIEPPYIAPGNTPIYHLYCVRAKKRDRLMHFLKDKGIETGIYYPVPQHLQKAVPGYQKGDFPETERAVRETLTLPMFPELTEAQQKYIIAAIWDFYS